MMDTNEDLALSYKTCPCCGITFECRHNKNCWCTGYSVAQSVSEVLRLKYTDCVCPVCLVEYGAEKKK